ncbi:hypothetical protein CC2G_013384 [Coprinopsis cinerea AmutBmut pab1-1]|nr:hypothetical protein CC2G_013384 [Coprinopsis cinerea AmutBmut pab1-1]
MRCYTPQYIRNTLHKRSRANIDWKIDVAHAPAHYLTTAAFHVRILSAEASFRRRSGAVTVLRALQKLEARGLERIESPWCTRRSHKVSSSPTDTPER